jgi:Holliday junction resolvasome RuvABC endonuclease subunit
MPKYRMYKDPQEFKKKIPKKPSDALRLLGLDLGNNCGVAIYDYLPKKQMFKENLHLFQWDLSPQGLESSVARYVRLREFLNVTSPDAIAYEDVKYSPPKEFFVNKKFGIPAILSRVSTAAEVLGGMKVTVATWAEEAGLLSNGYAISTIKKYATGSGKASKDDMIAALNKLLGASFDQTKYKSTGIDNVVDAAYVLLLMSMHVQASAEHSKL